jgi:hypothetical protein
MLQKINGLPTHILIVHAVVVLVPIAALLAVIAVVWPAARRKMGLLVPATALAGAFFTPIASQAGEWLQAHVPDSALVRRHAELGDGLLVWAGLLFVLAAALWVMDVAPARNWKLPEAFGTTLARATVSTLLVAVAVVSVVQVYRIGDSGAKAAWRGQVSTTAHAVPDAG